MAEKTATFSLNLAGNAKEVSGDVAAELEALRAKLEQSQVALKGMSSALRSLKGSSEEVAKAKEQLKARIDAEKGAVSQGNLAVLKQGHTYEQLQHRMRQAEAAQKKLEAKKQTDLLKHQAEQTKRLADGQKKLGEGFKYAGGPLGELVAKLDAFKGIATGSNSSMGLLAAGVGLVVAGVAALTAATVAAAVKLGIFVLTGANALRSMNLMREAASGSAENAKNLGTQVDRIARIVPTAKTEINALAVAMTRDMSGGLSKATGPTIVAGIEAVSVATAAAGEQVGGTFKDLIERGKNFGRFWLSPQDLDKTGLRFTDVAASLAARLHVSLDKAKEVLFTNGAGLTAGVGALKDAINAKFGKVNAEKLLDFDVQIEKLHERMVGLTKGVVLEPLLKGIATFLAKFDETTVTGKSIQLIFTKLGNAIADISVAHLEDAIEGVETIVLYGLRAVEVMKGMGEALDNPIAQTALKGLEVAALALGGVVAALGVTVFGFGLVVGGVWKAFELLGEGAYNAYRFLADLKWSDLGKGIVDGIIGGITRGAKALWDSVTGLASKIKGAFTGALDMHSPSKVFEAYGKQTTEGYSQGVGRGAPTAQRAVEAMAPSAPAPRASAMLGGGGGGGGQNIVVHVAIHLPEGMKSGPAQETAKAITAPGILRELTRAIREGLVTQGVPTQAVPA